MSWSMQIDMNIMIQANRYEYHNFLDLSVDPLRLRRWWRRSARPFLQRSRPSWSMPATPTCFFSARLYLYLKFISYIYTWSVFLLRQVIFIFHIYTCTVFLLRQLKGNNAICKKEKNKKLKKRDQIQVFGQGEKWHLNLDTDLSELENRWSTMCR